MLRLKKTGKLLQLLDENDVVWMSSTTREQRDMSAAAAHFKGGTALIGGLGLGIIVKMLQSKADRIIVVEIDGGVIGAIMPEISFPNVFVIKQDIEKYINDAIITGWEWDFIYIDTWSDLDYLRLPAVYQFKKKCEKLLRPKGKVLMWGEWLMKQEYKRELRLWIESLRTMGLKHFPTENLEKIKEHRPYFYEFCLWLRNNPSIWNSDPSPYNKRRISLQIGRCLRSFLEGPEYLKLCEPTKAEIDATRSIA